MTTSPVPRVGSRFGKYHLTRLIGRGGMGDVYEAYDTVKDRVVAIKVLSEGFAHDPVYRERFQRESHAAARLQEAHVIPIHDYGEIDGHLYIDMRLVQGTDLRTMLKIDGPLPPDRAVALITQVASAVDAAHADRLIHRDIKPDNILIAPDGFAYLVDFGIAHTSSAHALTGTGSAIGTFDYMAPERFGAGHITSAVDVYSLACVLYECLTGARPYPADSHAEIIRAHLFEPPPRPSVNRPSVPCAFDPVIARGMAKQPADRYRAAADLATSARRALAATGWTGRVGIAAAPTDPTPPNPQKFGPGPPAPVQEIPFPWHREPSASPAPAANYLRRWVLIGATIFFVVALAIGFGISKLSGGQDDTQAHDSAPMVDLRTLDVGKYSMNPRPVSGQPTEDEARYLEAFRLAEALADPYKVDPTLDHRYFQATPDPKVAATGLAGSGIPIAQPVLEKFGMISAYLVLGLSKRSVEFDRSQDPADALQDFVMSFPNPDAATRAAAEIDAVDFAANTDNKHASIPGYPQAKAHYRPDSPSIGATMAQGSLVVSLIVRNTNGDLDALMKRVQRAFDLQVPLMDHVIPNLAATLTSVSRDPDHMLSRTLRTDESPAISGRYGSIGPRAAALCESSQAHKEGLFELAGVDRCAITADSQLVRARDEEAAAALLPRTIEADAAEYIDHEVSAPEGLTNARCLEQKEKIWADDVNVRFYCGVVFGRYLAFVWSNEEQDARQRAAAQYAILVNS